MLKQNGYKKDQKQSRCKGWCDVHLNAFHCIFMSKRAGDIGGGENPKRETNKLSARDLGQGDGAEVRLLK